jgi:hypothetical protein
MPVIPGIAYQYAPKVVLEGDYSDWTIYDTVGPDPWILPTFFRQTAITNREETEILICSISYLDPANPQDTQMVLRKYTIATKTLSDVIVDDALLFNTVIVDKTGVSFPAFVAYQHYTAHGTYVVALGGTINTTTKLYIFKNGSLIKTFTDSDLGIASGSIRSASISPRGKYIVVSGYITALADLGWVVLVGS